MIIRAVGLDRLRVSYITEKAVPWDGRRGHSQLPGTPWLMTFDPSSCSPSVKERPAPCSTLNLLFCRHRLRNTGLSFVSNEARGLGPVGSAGDGRVPSSLTLEHKMADFLVAPPCRAGCPLPTVQKAQTCTGGCSPWRDPSGFC